MLENVHQTFQGDGAGFDLLLLIPKPWLFTSMPGSWAQNLKWWPQKWTCSIASSEQETFGIFCPENRLSSFHSRAGNPAVISDFTTFYCIPFQVLWYLGHDGLLLELFLVSLLLWSSVLCPHYNHSTFLWLHLSYTLPCWFYTHTWISFPKIPYSLCYSCVQEI